MSLILTYVKKDGEVHMLSDSCWTISDTGIYSIEPDVRKSFVKYYKHGKQNKKLMIAFTGAASIFQYLKYEFEFPPQKNETDMVYIYRTMIAQLRKDPVFSSMISEKLGVEVAVVMNGKIYQVDNQLCVFENKQNFNIVGFASEYFRCTFDILTKVAEHKITDENFKETFQHMIEVFGSVSSMVAPPYKWDILKNK